LSTDRDVVIVSVSGSRLSPQGYVRSTYSEHEIDLFGVYCGDLDRAFLLPVSVAAGRHAVQLRLRPARNGQRACINLAEDFDFDGAIAQLEERCHGMAEVVGSSPTSSTPPIGPIKAVGSEQFRLRLGQWLEAVAAGEELLVTYRGRPRVKLSPAP
jgi:PD-(D/E)XK nuclease superfamily protein